MQYLAMTILYGLVFFAFSELGLVATEALVTILIVCTVLGLLLIVIFIMLLVLFCLKRRRCGQDTKREAEV